MQLLLTTAPLRFVCYRLTTSTLPRLLPQCRPSRTSSSLQTLRTYATKARHAFEVDANISKNAVLYTYTNERFFRLLSIFGVVQFVCWANLAVFAYSSLKKIQPRGAEGTEIQGSLWGRVLSMQQDYSGKIALLCAGIGKNFALKFRLIKNFE